MFEEMDLQWDLDELEKVKSELATSSSTPKVAHPQLF
jgi:hypothetical protein